jgi:polar amino acid transport system substrate-binding protein
MRPIVLAVVLFGVALQGYAREWVVSQPATAHLTADIAQSVMTEVYRRLNQPVRFESIPLARSLYMLNRGEIDADLFRSKAGHPEYPQTVPVKIPIVSDDLVAYGVGQVLTIKGWPSLRPYRLVTVRGIKAIEYLGPDYRIEYVNLAEQAFKMVDAGRADLAIFARGAICTPYRLGLSRIRIQEPAIQSFLFYHHVHISHADWVPRIEAELLHMQKDGTLQRLQNEARKRWANCQ